MPYGAPPAPPHYVDERGLIGLFLCGSLAGQFEKLYSRINANDFSKVYAPGFDTQDALLANRASAGDPSFTIPISNGEPIKDSEPAAIHPHTWHGILPAAEHDDAAAHRRATGITGTGTTVETLKAAL